MSAVEVGFAPPGQEFIMPDIIPLDQSPNTIYPSVGFNEPGLSDALVQSKLELVKSTNELSAFPDSLGIRLERTVIEFDSPHRHMKDPSFTFLPDGRSVILISVNDTDTQSGWIQVAYVAEDIKAPVWKKLGIVPFNGIDPKFVDQYGEEVEKTICAAGAFPNGEGLVVQDLCFHDGGSIHIFKGSDPTNLEYAGIAVKSDLEKGIAGVYDGEPVSGLGPNGGVINLETGEEEFLISVTAVGSYREVMDGESNRRLFFPQDGSIRLAKRKGGWIGEYEYADKPILTERQVPGHKHTLEGGEWVLEGGKISELDSEAEEFNLIYQSRNEDGTFRIELVTIAMDDLRNLMDSKGGGKRFLHYFTAFIDGPEGSRQRGYLASSDTLDEVPTVLGIIEPMRTEGNFKETGHGTVHIKRNSSVVLSQAA